jgi:DNA modification methylase
MPFVPASPNHLYYGDNLDILREYIGDESIDLIYLDPPFNSQATYNVLFRAPTGERSQAQIEAFEDTWHWNEHAERAFDEVMHSDNTDAAELLRAMRAFLKENDMMAYLTMMAIRLLELRRVLKPTGSLYLHCDPVAGHYLKILMDAIFGPEHFRNQIIWKRTTAHSDAKQGSKHYGRTHDLILFYVANPTEAAWNQLYTPLDSEYRESHYRNVDENGRRFMWDNLTGPGGAAKGNAFYEVLGVKNYWRYSRENMEKLLQQGLVAIPPSGKTPRLKRYLDEQAGRPLGDVWTDIFPINSQAKERLGYPTQKPQALLERIIQASSNEGDIVLDPFCGCGTAVHAAQKLRRQWIGIDITHLAISLIEKRLKDAFPGIQYDVHGTPTTLDGARDLALRDKYQFQWWAVSLVDAVPYGGKKKGADAGIDGIIYFKPDGKSTEKAIVSVKGGEHVSVPMIRELAHVVEREQAKLGILITLARPTRTMETEAGKMRYLSPYHGSIPKIQILTIADLFAGKKPHIPFIDPTTFRRAPQEQTDQQGQLF